MRRLALVFAVLLALAVIVLVAVRIPAVQDQLLARALAAGFAAPAKAAPEGGMRVVMCGTSSPLPHPERAQACVAVLVDDRMFIVDAGAGSAGVSTLLGLPLHQLTTAFVTHYHSDHIAALPDFALISWVRGRPAPLEIVGPPGITRVVEGMNRAYTLDRSYRVAHHGAELLPPELADMVARTIEAGVVYEEDGLVVRAFPVDHSPVSPAFAYRFEYGGRSVVVSGDTVADDLLAEASQGADLLLTDALSMPIVQGMERAARDAGRNRNAKIFADIQDYHADVADLGTLAERAGVNTLALYHLVPAPRNAIMESVFRRGLPDDAFLTDDGMTFDLLPGSDTVIVGD